MRLKPVVLSIDDDLNFRKMIELVLLRFGLHIKSVSNSTEFMEAAKTLQPDLYLIDLQLEAAKGNDLIETIRTTLNPKAFIIVISGDKSQDAILKALELGANDYIVKPLDRVLLATKLSQYIETDEIREHRSEWKILPKGSIDVKVKFSGSIVEIDELGVKFIGPTLTPKGTVLKMASDFFERIGAKEKEYLITVTSNWLIPETQKYGAYAEFDGVDTEFFNVLRRWLTENTVVQTPSDGA